MKRSDGICLLIILATWSAIVTTMVYRHVQPAPTWVRETSERAHKTERNSPADGFEKVGEFRYDSFGWQHGLNLDGSRVVLGFNNHGTGTFTVRDARFGGVLSEFEAPFGMFYFLPESESIIVHGPHAITAWHAVTGKQLWSVSTPREERGVRSTRGAIVTSDGTHIKVRAGDNGDVVRSYQSRSEVFALSADGSSVLVSDPGSSRVSVVWVPSGTARSSFDLPKGTTLWNAALDSTGTIAAVQWYGDNGRELSLWDLRKGTRIPFALDAESIDQFALTPDGSLLIVHRYSTNPIAPFIGDHGFVEVWEIGAKRLKGRIKASEFGLSLDGRSLSLSNDEGLQVWQLKGSTSR
jgi:hypothetical protein